MDRILDNNLTIKYLNGEPTLVLNRLDIYNHFLTFPVNLIILIIEPAGLEDFFSEHAIFRKTCARIMVQS